MFIETKTLFTFDEKEKQAIKTVVNCLRKITERSDISYWDTQASECITNLYWLMVSTPEGEKFWQDEIAD